MEKTCSRCILDNRFPNIYFDEDGVCNQCHQYDRRCSKYATNTQNQKELRSLVEKVKSRGKDQEYDCIQGVSGGRDSTYTLYLLKQWGLNPLAVHVDNRMDTSIAVKNIKNACRKLDVDLHNHTVEWEEFKDLQRAFLFASVPSVDIPSDHAFVTILYNIAEENDIKYVFVEKFVNPKFSNVIAGEINGEVLTLNAAHGLSEKEIQEGQDYITLMYDNLRNLEKALK